MQRTVESEQTSKYCDQYDELRKEINDLADRKKEFLNKQKEYLLKNTPNKILEKSLAEVIELFKDDPAYNKGLGKENVPETSSVTGTIQHSMVNTPFPSGAVSMTARDPVAKKKRTSQRRSKANAMRSWKTKALETPARPLRSNERFILLSSSGSPLTISGADMNADLWKRIISEQH